MPEIVAHIVQPPNWLEIIISVCSVVISIFAIRISITTNREQIKHNKNSVKPILNIILGDYEDDIYVQIDNNGVGPAIVKQISCTKGQEVKNSLIELIPTEVRVTSQHNDECVKMFPMSDFVEDIKGRTIAPGGHITLLRTKNANYKKRFALRSILREINIQVEYMDIYEEKMTTERTLTFFGRTITNAAERVKY